MKKTLLICGLVFGLLLFGCIGEEKHFLRTWIQENPSDLRVYFEIFDENNQTVKFSDGQIVADVEIWTLIPDGEFYYLDRKDLVYKSTTTVSDWRSVHPDYGSGLSISYSAINITEEDADVGRLILTVTSGNRTEGMYENDVRLRP